MKAAMEAFSASTIWVLCSVGMVVFNKCAIGAFPLECSLVGLQMGFSVLVLTAFGWSSLHVGSFYDLLRWLRVVPFFVGVLLTSILALKVAPMSLVVVFRGLAPLFSMAVERFYPNPMEITSATVFSIFVMVVGVTLYAWELDTSHLSGICWVLLNNLCVVGDRVLQRLMLAKDQHPVSISMTSVAVINNACGMAMVLGVALLKGEIYDVVDTASALTPYGVAFIVLSCIIGVGISYAGIWLQSLISATSFLVLATSSKFAILIIEVVAGDKRASAMQFVGATITILGGVAYGKAREIIEAKHSNSEEAQETEHILTKKV